MGPPNDEVWGTGAQGRGARDSFPARLSHLWLPERQPPPWQPGLVGPHGGGVLTAEYLSCILASGSPRQVPKEGGRKFSQC